MGVESEGEEEIVALDEEEVQLLEGEGAGPADEAADEGDGVLTSDEEDGEGGAGPSDAVRTV